MEWGFQLQLKIEKYGLHIRMWAIRAYFGEKNCRDRHFSNEMRILAVFVLPLVICLGRPFEATNMTKRATVVSRHVSFTLSVKKSQNRH